MIRLFRNLQNFKDIFKKKIKNKKFCGGAWSGSATGLKIVLCIQELGHFGYIPL